VVGDTPLPVVAGKDPAPSGAAGRVPCPTVGTVFEANREGFDEPPPTEKTRPTTNATTAKPPTTAALRRLARLDKRIGWFPLRKYFLQN
jgi:hypothetical protein